MVWKRNWGRVCGGRLGVTLVAVVGGVLESWGIMEGFGIYLVGGGGMEMRGDVCVVSKDGSTEK